VELRETCTRLQASLDDGLAESRRFCEAGVQVERRRCEEALCAHEQVVQSHFLEKVEATVGSVVDGVVQRSSQGLLSTQQDVVDLRAEFSNRLQAEASERDKVLSALQKFQEAQAARDCEHLDAPDWLAVVDEQGRLRRAVESQTDRLGTLHKEVQLELARLAAKSQRESAASCEEVTILRQELERLRELISSSMTHTSDLATDQLCEALVREEVQRQLVSERATLIAPRLDDGLRKEIQTSLHSEAQLRKASEEQLVSDLREMLREERHSRERDSATLTLRVDTAEDRILVDSGKREERDRDMRTLMKRVEEELDMVKRRMNAIVPPTVASLHGSCSARGPGSSPGSAVGSISGRMSTTNPSSTSRLVQLINP